MSDVENHTSDLAIACSDSFTVREMLFPQDAKNNELLRKKGMHSLQTIMDAIAYAQNIQIRLLRPDALKGLDKRIKSVITDEKHKANVQEILERAGLNRQRHQDLYDSAILKNIYDWMIKLQIDTDAEKPTSLTPEWLQAMVSILPLVERKVWLTVSSNPLPAYALCRMQSSWALFTLLHLWQKIQDENSPYAGNGETLKVPDTFGIKGFTGRPLPKFSLPDEMGKEVDCVLLVGPAFEISDLAQDNEPCHKEFWLAFHNFNKGLAKAGFSEEFHSTVNEDEIREALAARIEFPADEIILRGKKALQILQYSLEMVVDKSALTKYRCSDDQEVCTLSRADWYTVTVLSTWLVRWENMIAGSCKENEQIMLHWARRRVAVIATFVSKEIDLPSWHLKICEASRVPQDIERIANKLPKIGTDNKDSRIDRVEILYNRLKERQNAAWSRKVIAVNNLLLRHGSKSTEWGEDEIELVDRKPGEGIRAEEAGHLLKGFGKTVCKYLAAITRADLTDIFWLDYSQSPPRLIHAGGYARAIPHIVNRDKIFQKFDQWAWRDTEDAPANMGKLSISQAYRVIATGKEDSHPEHKYGKAAPTKEEMHDFYVDCYADTKPEDAIALPLLVNKRPIGALLIGGFVPGQFNRRLLTPLRTIAGMVAMTMYHQNQLWQMRRLNYLFAKSNAGLAYRELGGQNSNVLKGVVRCLTNIFLCPAVQIWLRDEGLPFKYQLSGYNWPNKPESESGVPICEYRPRARRDNSDPSPENDSFITLAIDLWKESINANDADSSLALFSQGRYDPTLALSTGYNAKASHEGLTKLGKDFLPEHIDPNAAPFIKRRDFIFRTQKMRDIMAFALVRPLEENSIPSEKNSAISKKIQWEVVGAITLHDRGNDGNDHAVAWDSGWCPVVAHMQTYLPYIFTQADVLSNPVMAAQAYYLHAGRAALVSAKDTAVNMHKTLRGVLAPDHSLRHDINELLSQSNNKDPRQVLLGASKQLSDAWQAVENLRHADWTVTINTIAQTMLEYRNFAAVTKENVIANEDFSLYTEMRSVISKFKDHFSAKHISIEIIGLERLEFRLPLIWFRMVLNDLIHNVAKYAIQHAVFQIHWDDRHNKLLVRNEGPYDPARDDPQQLLRYQSRGSAAKFDTLDQSNENLDKKGGGIGLWGSRLICHRMGLDFVLKVTPMKAEKPIRSDAIAWYCIELYFPEHMKVRHIVPPKDYY